MWYSVIRLRTSFHILWSCSSEGSGSSYLFFGAGDVMKAAREQSCRQLPRTKKKGALRVRRQRRRRVRPRKPSRWSRRRSAQPRLVHVHPCCRLQAERLSPDPPAQGRTTCSPQKRQCSPAGLWVKMSRANRQVSARDSSSNVDKRDGSTGATRA